MKFLGDWKPDERVEVARAIEKVPQRLRKFVSSFERQKVAPAGPGHSAYNHNNGSMTFYDKGTRAEDGSVNKKQIHESVYHEMAHSLEKQKGLIDSWSNRVGWQRGKKGWAKSPKNKGFVYDYGKKDPFEDFSTSFAMYFTDPKRLAKASPEKYSFINELVIRNKDMNKSAEDKQEISLEFLQGEELVPDINRIPKTEQEKQESLAGITKKTNGISKGAMDKRSLMLRGALGGFSRSGLLGTKPSKMLQGGGIKRLVGGISAKSVDLKKVVSP